MLLAALYINGSPDFDALKPYQGFDLLTSNSRLGVTPQKGEQSLQKPRSDVAALMASAGFRLRCGHAARRNLRDRRFVPCKLRWLTTTKQQAIGKPAGCTFGRICKAAGSQLMGKFGKLYCCFVDFKKAFDTVPRAVLWQVLEELGVCGRILDIIKSLYAHDSAVVRSSQGISAILRCLMGVKQVPAKPNAVWFVC